MYEIFINNAADLMNLTDGSLHLFKKFIFVKKNGAWSFLDADMQNINLDMHLCNTLASAQKLKLTNIVDDTMLYELVKTDFDNDVRYYKELLKLTYDRKFFTVLDLKFYLGKFGYTVCTDLFYNTLPAYRCLYIKKDDKFRITFPYYTSPTVLLNKNALFKELCRNVCTLYLPKNIYPYSISASAPRYSIMWKEWQREFDFVAKKVLEWSERT